MPAASKVEVQPAPVRRRLLRLEAERLRRDISQRDVAALVRTSQPRICAIERDRAKPGRSLALRLSKLYSVEKPESLFEEVKL